MDRFNMLKRYIFIVLASLSVPIVWASGFKLPTQSAAASGDRYTGIGAEAEDASTGFYNAAGLTRFDNTELVIGGHLIRSSVDVEGTVSSASASANTTDWAAVPLLHMAMPVWEDKLYFGFGVTVPFGLATHYAKNSGVQAAATLSSLETINFNPSLAYKVTDWLSVAAGVNLMHMKASLDSVFSGEPFYNHGDSWGYGYNAGILVELSPTTRFGLSYRSQVAQRLKGRSERAGVVNDALSVGIRLPSTALFSAYHEFNERWGIKGTIEFTQWASVDKLELLNTALGKVVIFTQYRNTWRGGVGTHYQIDERWKVRFGIDYEQTPTQMLYRDIRLPEGNRWAVGVGGQYAVNKSVSLDVGYFHVFVAEAGIIGDFTGKAKNGHADVLGLQLNWQL